MTTPFAEVPAAMRAMSKPDATFAPAGGEIATLHDARYVAFQRLQALGRDIR